MRRGAYVKKAAVDNIKSKLGRDMLAYQTIQAHNKRELTAQEFIKHGNDPPAALEGMVDMGDGRMLSGGLKLDLKTKRIITTSYKPDWTCIMCGPHGGRPAFNLRGSASGTGGGQAVILSDQSYPPILPASGTDKCMVVLRVENGSIPDLVDEFLTQFGNGLFPASGIIMIGSPAHLANVGLSAYVSDLLDAIEN
jgi:hypothetical protein